MAKSATIKAVALPVEHGSWSLWLEPALLGWLVAPSVPGSWLLVASFALFLLRQPLKIAWIDRHRKRQYQRTQLAERFVLLYITIALLSGLAAILTTRSTDVLIPMLLVSPLLVVQVYYDMRHESRHWLPEISATILLASVAASIAMAGGWGLVPALALSVIIACRAVPTICYVRARLRLEKGQPVRAGLSTALHLVALMVLVIFMQMGLISLLSVVAGGILLVRAVYGLSRWRRPARPQIIGIQEIVFGLIIVTMAVLGFQ